MRVAPVVHRGRLQRQAEVAALADEHLTRLRHSLIDLVEGRPKGDGRQRLELIKRFLSLLPSGFPFSPPLLSLGFSQALYQNVGLFTEFFRDICILLGSRERANC